MLTPHFRLLEGEGATGSAARLSRLHTGRADLRLLNHFDIDVRAYLRGDVDAVNAFAVVAGIDAAGPFEASILRFSGHREFREERLSREFIRPDGERFCPACLIADGEVGASAYARLAWRFRPVRVCPIHGIVLNLRQNTGSETVRWHFRPKTSSIVRSLPRALRRLPVSIPGSPTGSPGALPTRAISWRPRRWSRA